jgi:DNA mismatch repair protein MutS
LAPEEQLTGRRARQILEDQFSSSLRGFGLEKGEPAIRASATALSYARETQRSELGHVREIFIHDPHRVMTVDETTVRNLDLLRNQSDGTTRTTLLGLLDRTQTSMGGRLLRQWMLRPLLDLQAIQARHDAVEELVDREDRRLDLRAQLATIADLERLLSRAVLGSLSPREASALLDSLAACPQLLSSLSACRSDLLAAAASIDPAEDLAAVLQATLQEEPAVSLKAGGVIAEGVNPELDECRSLARDSKQHILALEAEEREKTGISSLKIGFNRVFGYYIEVTKSHLERVPEEYVRKQTLANAERFITSELKELEEEILSAEERQLRLEQEEFDRLVETVARSAKPLQTLATFLAATDVLATFAEVAAQQGYCRPTMKPPGDAIVMREGRHPIVEEALSEEFVPNDCDIDRDEAQIILLTGPNMGGKSTYLRQIALAVLMAQMGSFVAASEARLGLVDRLFTRVGASDDLARGESTFMVEMIETANILRYATADSLLVLDEVGRGTSTFDGLSLAWAIVEHLHRGERPKTVFATHYHELTELAVLAGVANYTLAVKEWDDRIVFLRRVVAGSADKSYGIHVARLAGLPPEVLERASEVLSNLERHEYDLRGRPRLAQGDSGPPVEGPDQLALFTPPEELVASVLRDLDLERLTPLAALNLLHSLRSRLDGE